MIQNVNLEIPHEFIEGLENGSLQRYGGIIQDSLNKRVRGWLKDVPIENGINSQVVSQLNSISSSLQLTNALQLANLGVSIAGFAMLNLKLNKISKQITELSEQVKEIKEIALINQKINLIQIVSHYQNFEEHLKDFYNANDKTSHKLILAQAYGDLCLNNIAVANLLKDEVFLKSLSNEGIEKISLLHKFICLSFRSQVTFNMLINEKGIAKERLQNAKENLFEINRTLYKGHKNLG